MSNARFEGGQKRRRFAADIAIDATEAQDIKYDSNATRLKI